VAGRFKKCHCVGVDECGKRRAGFDAEYTSPA